MTDKILVFDMDGTIADLYGVNGWLEMLRSYNPTPYRIAKPLYDMDELKIILDVLKLQGWRIVVTTWLSKDSTNDYDRQVRKAKLEWLKKYNFPYDEIHLVKYGTTKADCTRKYKCYQVLIDDNKKVRDGWRLGATIDANKNIIDGLLALLDI